MTWWRAYAGRLLDRLLFEVGPGRPALNAGKAHEHAGPGPGPKASWVLPATEVVQENPRSWMLGRAKFKWAHQTPIGLVFDHCYRPLSKLPIRHFPEYLASADIDPCEQS